MKAPPALPSRGSCVLDCLGLPGADEADQLGGDP
jgi:hypothetical protein